MKAGHTLLMRVRRPEFAIARRHISDAETRDSILAHLRAMCLTRQGTMLTCPDYGTATVSEMVHAFPDAIAAMAKAIRHTIQSYEPRLTNVRIKHIPTEDLSLRYEITAQVIRDNAKVPIQFETSIDASRKMSFR